MPQSERGCCMIGWLARPDNEPAKLLRLLFFAPEKSKIYDFMANHDHALMEQVLEVPKRQRKSDIKHQR